MKENYFKLLKDVDEDMNVIYANARGGVKYTLREVEEELNSLEETRHRKDKQIKKLRSREEKLQQFVYGVMALLFNGELWCDE